MKVMFKKMLISLILTIMLFNCILGNSCFAGAEEVINSITNAIGGIASVMMWPLRIKMVGIAFVIGEVVVTSIAQADGGQAALFVTPFEIFFNKVTITNVNFFDDAPAGSASALFRDKVAVWYYNVRAIALAALVVVGVYVGIRMALSTLAEDKAKYKKMLTDFVMSIALLFLMQYIIIFIIEFNNVLVKVLEELIKGMGGKIDIEHVLSDIALNALFGIGINSITSTFVYVGIIILTFCFVIAYINRMLKVAFLIVISPLITITYSIDKMKDNKSQALDTWFKELLYTILIQPFHCIIYMSYISVCFTLITTGNTAGGWGALLGVEYNRLANGVLAILCLLFVKHAEKMVRTIFGFKDDNEKTSFAAGVAKTAIVMKTIPKAGAAVRGISSKAGAFMGVAKGVGGEIAGAVRGSKLAAKISSNKFVSKASDAVKPAIGELKNITSKANEALTKATKEVKKSINGVKKFTGAPKRFFDNKIKKYDNIIGSEAKSLRAKRFAAFKRNSITRFRNLNSTSNAIAKIATMGTLIAKDNSVGEAMKAHDSFKQGAQNYMNGSAAAAAENISTATSFKDTNNDLKGASGVVDGEERKMEQELEVAEQVTAAARKEYKSDKTNSEKKENYMAALERETEIRRALTSKRKHKHKDANTISKTQDKLQNILDKGTGGVYKSGSKAEKKITGKISTTFKGVLQSEVDNGNISREEANNLTEEFEKEMAGLLGKIDARAGLVDDFDGATVQKLVNDSIKPILDKIPAFQDVASSEVEIINGLIENYRVHKDEGFVYNELQKYQSGGGTIEKLVEQMYKEYE